MKPTGQWTLASEQGEKGKGRTVEKILYDHYREKEQESLAHSWIIELDEKVDPEIRDLFTDEEWQEICEEKPPDLVMADSCLAESMIRFLGVNESYSLLPYSTHLGPTQVKTPAELREVLETTTFRAPSQAYNRDEHYDPEWVDLVMRKMYNSTFLHWPSFFCYVEAYAD